MSQFWRVIKREAAASARAFARSRAGNMALIYALCATVLMGLLGITVDFTRAQTLRAQMQNAADGAALVAERSSNLTLARRKELAQAYYNAEMGNTTPGADFEVFELESGGHRVEAGYTMPLTLAALVKNEPWRIEVAAEAEAQASPPIEVALALDNTGSMVNDMGTLRQGAQQLADYLLGIDGDTVSVAVVPFVGQVNIGTNNTQYVDTAGDNPLNGIMLEGRFLGSRATSGSPLGCTNTTTYPTSYGGFPIRWIQGNASNPSGYRTTTLCYAFSPENVNIWSLYANLPANTTVTPPDRRWGGCVESRPPPYDIDDTAPTPGASTGATMFVPYFSLDDGGNVSSPANNWITDNTNYDRTNIANITGSPTFTQADNTSSGKNLLRTLGVYKYRSGVTVSTSTSNTSGYGPNRGCPTAITPLTTSKSTVDTAIQAMVQWNGGGTNQIEGLAWAWRVISPGEPFTQGRPYDNPNDPVRKVIVLFTDGDNTSLDSNNTYLESDYEAMGYRSLWHTYQTTQVPHGNGPTATWSAAVLSQYRLPGSDDSLYTTPLDSKSNTEAYMVHRQGRLCDAIKARGIEIYTIGFRITAGSTADNLLRGCATQDGAHFYHADNQTQLLQAFNAIGSGIGQLRVTH